MASGYCSTANIDVRIRDYEHGYLFVARLVAATAAEIRFSVSLALWSISAVFSSLFNVARRCLAWRIARYKFRGTKTPLGLPDRSIMKVSPR